MNHYNCEANKCMNALTKKGLAILQDFVIFDSLPLDICMLLFYDNLGIVYESLYHKKEKKKKTSALIKLLQWFHCFVKV